MDRVDPNAVFAVARISGVDAALVDSAFTEN
jgi:hypothetical protein